MMQSTRVLLFVTVFMLCALSSCGGSRLQTPAETGGANAAIQAKTGPPGLGAVLPPPSALPPLPGSGKQVSYSEDNYIDHGREYLTSLPNQNVSISGDAARFDADWSAATDFAPDGLGFCCFQFEDLGSYTRETELRYGWQDPPDEVGTAWLALANWDTDSWDWQQCNAPGIWALASFEPYTSPASEMVAMVLMANAETNSLRWIRLGPPLLSADLKANPSSGQAPLDVTLDASGSTEGAGATTVYLFDLDDNGTYEVGGMIPSWDVTVPAGQHDYHLLVRSEYGIEDTASTTCTGFGTWTHSWGELTSDTIFSVVTDGQEYIYAVGAAKYYSPVDGDVLVLKYTLEGTLVWAHYWGGDYWDWGQAAVFDDQHLYVGGFTEGFGPGQRAALIQCWDTDGNVEWTVTAGIDDVDSEAQINSLSVRGGMLYLAGSQTWDGGDPGALVMQCDESGAVQWGKVWHGSDPIVANGIAAHYNFISEVTKLHIAGQSGNDVLYLKLDDEGGLLGSRVWTGASAQNGKCISVYGMLDEVIIGGWVSGPPGVHALLLRATNGLAKRWGGESEESIDGILREGDELYLCGLSTSFTFDLPAALFMKCTTDNVVQDLRIWDSGSADDWFYSICRFPGSGILLGGTCGSADGGDWIPMSDSFSDQSGTWADASGTLDDYSCETTAPSDAAHEITDGLIDTGGGNTDTLLMARRF